MNMLHRILLAFIVAIVAVCAASPAFARKVGPEFQVNTFTPSRQSLPKVAMLTDGGFVVVWYSVGQDGDAGGIYAQRYNANGSHNGGEFRVNTTTEGNQFSPAVAALSNGGFAVVWSSEDGSGYSIYGQRFRPDGTPAGPEFQVNTFTVGPQLDADVAALTSGGFVVVWRSQGQDGARYGIYGQRFGNAGARLGGEFRVDALTAADQRQPAVAALGNGGFIVVWDSINQQGESLGIYGRRFRANGTPVGAGQFRVDQARRVSLCCASVAGFGEDSFVVIWRGRSQNFGRRFDGAGALGPEFVVSNNPSRAPSSSVAALNDGRFVVVWRGRRADEDGYGIFGQRFDAAGNKVRGEFHVNTTIADQQSLPSVAGFSNGRFVVVWIGPDGSSYGIFGQRFSN
jgi:hypothetical protein